MNLHTWLESKGCPMTAAELAAFLGVSKTAVSLWRAGGVPIRHMDAIVAKTDGAVTKAALLDHKIARRLVNEQDRREKAAA